MHPNPVEKTMNKQECLDHFQTKRQEWDRFIQGLSTTQLTQPNTCGTWSAKDAITHVGIWTRFATAQARAHARGTPATPHEMWGVAFPSSELSDDALNEWLVAQTQHWTVGEVVGTEREVFVQLLAAMQALPERDLVDPAVEVEGFPWKKDRPLYEILEEMSINHAEEHMTKLITTLVNEPAGWVDMAPGVRRRIIGDGVQMMQVQIHIAKGSAVPRHRHVHEQLTHIVAGTLDFVLAEVTHTLHAGDTLVIPSNEWHSVVAVEDVIAIDTFSPPREDFRSNGPLDPSIYGQR